MAKSGEKQILDLIDIQLKLLKEKSIPKEYRSLIREDLKLIKAYQEELDELKNKTTVEAIKALYSSETLQQEDELVDIIKDVQKYLTESKSKILLDSDDSAEKEKAAAVEIRNYIEMNNITSSVLPNREDLVQFIIRDILKLSVVTDAFQNPRIEEIEINDYNDIRFVIDGEEKRQDLTFRSPEHLSLLVSRLSRRTIKAGGKVKKLSEDIPYIRFRFDDTTRISAMTSPIAHRCAGAAKGAVTMLSIRKQQDKAFDSSFLLKKKSINEFGDLLIETLAKYGISMNFYGGTNTGKTAMLRRYLTTLPDHKRIITIAEVDEMNLLRIDRRKYLTHEDDPTIPVGQKIDNPKYLRPINSVVMWECPDQNIVIFNGIKGFSGLVNAALTFSPSVIILQESKGGEIKDVVNAAVSGHQVFTTIHATDARAFFLRILLMYQESGANVSDNLIMKQIPLAFPVIVNAMRFEDGSRKLADISELVGYNCETQEPVIRPILKFIPTGSKMSPDGRVEEVLGDYYVNSSGWASPRLKSILINHSIPTDVIQRLNELENRTSKFNIDSLGNISVA